MRTSKLTSFLVAAALASSPIIVSGNPAPSAQTSTAVTPASAAVSPDVEQYAAREAKDTKVAKFQGGGEVVIIGASAVTILLVILIVLIIL